MAPAAKLLRAWLIPDLSANHWGKCSPACNSIAEDKWSQNKWMEQVLRLDQSLLGRRCVLMSILGAVAKSKRVHRLQQEENQCLSISWEAP